MTRNDLVEAVAMMLMLRSGGWFEAIRDMPEEKAHGDAEAVVDFVLRNVTPNDG